jgi:hypothetical protein
MQIIENKKTINIIISTFILYGKAYHESEKQSNMSKTEQNVLMTIIFHIVKRKKGQTYQNWSKTSCLQIWMIK